MVMDIEVIKPGVPPEKRAIKFHFRCNSCGHEAIVHADRTEPFYMNCPEIWCSDKSLCKIIKPSLTSIIRGRINGIKEERALKQGLPIPHVGEM